MVYEEAFKNSPLIVLNNFSGEGMQLKLIASMFQNMFPTINLTTVSIIKDNKFNKYIIKVTIFLQVNLSTIRRCVCLNYNTITKTMDFRHYAIKVVPVGLSRGVKKIVQAKVPNLSKCQDISEFLTKPTVSESEAEDDETNCVTLSQELSSRGNHANSKSIIRLFELGPRITLQVRELTKKVNIINKIYEYFILMLTHLFQLIKVENGLLDGEVLSHELVHKTEEEKLAIKKKREEKKKIKEKRKKIQEENRKKKEAQLQKHKEKSLEGIQKKRERDMLLQKFAKESEEKTEIEEDDDAQYYREEVGEEPDKGKDICMHVPYVNILRFSL